MRENWWFLLAFLPMVLAGLGFIALIAVEYIRLHRNL